MANISLPPDFKEVLRLLNSHQVEYLLIGGYIDMLDGIEVNFIDLANLKINKKAAGRHKDLDDLENLP
jgi:predicted nucleotidyltransferase